MLVMNRTCKGMEMKPSEADLKFGAPFVRNALGYLPPEIRPLYAAAPDLVAALQQIEKLLSCEQPLEMIQRAFVRSGFARAALAKAEGQS